MDADEIAAGRQRYEARLARARHNSPADNSPADNSPADKSPAGTSPTTLSGTSLDAVYGPEGGAVPGFERIGWPGEYPFTRGIYTSGYVGKPWTIRQFAGFGSASDTNTRFRQLLGSGGHGLSVAFDMPTLMGLDSDHAKSRGEVGHCGVAVDSAQDMERLFDGIPLDEVSTSMTVSGPAVPLFCAYVVAAERAGVSVPQLAGTLQTDIFKEYIAQKEWLFPPEPHLRLIGDLMEWTHTHVPKYHPISISGYHIREAGSTAAQELAFTLADGFAYVELGIERGLSVNEFAQRLSFFFDAHIDFFEEIAKFRAARRIWARWMRDHYGATDERAQWLRFHTQTAGVSLTAQQPQNNVVRTAIEALAAVLGGTNSLHTNAMDEVLSLPTDEAAEVALRTQQVIAEETGVASVIDPLGGSWFIEQLTDEIERQVEGLFANIRELGDGRSMTSGIVAGINSGWFINQVADAASDQQRQLDSGERALVGVNAHTDTVTQPLAILHIPDEVEHGQVAELQQRRESRDATRVSQALDDLARVAESDGNLIPPLLEAVRAEATLGETCDVLRGVFGEYREPALY